MSASTALLEDPAYTIRRRRAPSLLRFLWIALVLWMASNVLVTMVATIATWEGAAHYRRMSDLCQWDCGWYAKVLDHGYDKSPYPTAFPDWPFHPLFPITAYPLHYWFKLSLNGSVVLTSKLELLLAIYAFLLLVSDHTEYSADYFRAGSLVAFNPYIIYAHAGYAEPLYFALIAMAFYFAGRHRWLLAGAAGGLASATRLIGFLFTFSYVIVWVKSGQWRFWKRKLDLNQVIGLLLCPVGAAFFALYLYHRIGDALVQGHVQVAWAKAPGNPFHLLWACLLTHGWPFVWGVMVAAALVLSGWLVHAGKSELGVFLAASILIPFSATWIGTARYIWWQPPFLYAIYRLLRRSSGAWLIYTACSSAMACFMVMQWFNGHDFVI
jgi:hypothetical protein